MAMNPNSKTSAYLQNMDEVAKVFNRFNPNGAGKISSTKLPEVLKALGFVTSLEEVNRMMEELDTDHDGFINLTEFASSCKGSITGEKCSVQDCSKMIQSVDANGDGNISFDEFQKMMTNSSAKASAQ